LNPAVLFSCFFLFSLSMLVHELPIGAIFLPNELSFSPLHGLELDFPGEITCGRVLPFFFIASADDAPPTE